MTSDQVAVLVRAIICNDAERVCRRLPTIPDELAGEIADHAALFRDAVKAFDALSGLTRRFGARAAGRD